MTVAPQKRLTTVEEAGFLSGEAALFRDSIRQSHGDLLGQCAVASRTAMAILCEGVAGPENMSAARAAWVRSISACQGAVLLAERGMVTEACALLRTGYEHMFFAGALVNDPAVLDRMRDQDTAERQKTIRLALANSDVGSVITAELREQLRQSLETPAGPLRISAFQAAEIAGLAAIFQTTYRQLSLIGTHANLTSVGASLGDSLTELRFVQVMDDLPQLLAHIVGCLQMGSGIFLTLQPPGDGAEAGETRTE